MAGRGASAGVGVAGLSRGRDPGGGVVGAPVFGAGAGPGREVHAVFPGDRPGVCLSLLRPRAAADPGGDGDDPACGRPSRRDSPAPPEGDVPLAAEAAAAGAGELAVGGRAGGPGRRGGHEPEPMGPLVRASPLEDAPGGLGGRAPPAVAPDPRRATGAGGPGVAGLPGGRPGRGGVLHDARADWRIPVRRLLTDAAAALADLWRATARAWDRFFFTPADPTPLGLIRAMLGVLLFWNLAVYGLDLRGFLGSEGWADPSIVRLFQGERAPYAWSFWMLVPDALLRPAWVACMAVLAMYALGLFSRVTAVLAWAIVVSTLRRAPVTVFGFDQVISTLALYLAATGASGQAVSLDRFLARLREGRAVAARRRRDGRWVMPSGVPPASISANLGLRLIQLHLILIYGMAGLAKLQGEAWWSGMAIWGTLASGEFSLIDFTWLAAWPYAMNVLTHAVLALEVGYGVLIWVRPLRPFVIASMVAMHLGIALAAPGLAEFGLAMIAANLAFASGPWLRSLVAGRDDEQPSGRVHSDGACRYCRKSMAMLNAADPARV